MDKRDLKIIIELDKNPRESYSIIGKRVGISKQAIKSRIDNLISTNVITTFITFSNMNALGIIATKIFFSFQDLSHSKKQEIITFLKNEKIVGGLMIFEGHYDLFTGIMAQNQLDLDDFISRFYNKYSNHIKEKKIVTLADSAVFPRGYLDEKKIKPYTKPKHFFVHPINRVELKLNDYKILGILTSNPLISWTDISRQTKIPLQTVISRYKFMEKNGVIDGFGILLNEAIFVSYVLMVELNNLSEDTRNSIMRFAKGHPNFILAVRIVGEWNYEFGIEGVNLQECLKAIDDFKKEFSHVIRSYVPLLLTKVEKMQNYKAN